MSNRLRRADLDCATDTDAFARPTARLACRRRKPAAAALPADLGLALVGAALIETLESRQMLDGIAQSGNTITLTGNATTANAFAITMANNVLTTKVNSTTKTFAYSTSFKINVVGGSAADTLTTGSTVAIPMYVSGGGGNDSLQTGAGNDSIDGGDGADSIDGGAGTDAVFNAENIVNVETGTAGNQITRSPTSLKILGSATSANTITVTLSADGKSVLLKCNANVASYTLANVGFFSIEGGAQGDSITVDAALPLGVMVYGYGGNDTIVSGGGNDIVNGGDGNDGINTQGGNDILNGGAGTDVLDGGTGADTATGGETYLNVETLPAGATNSGGATTTGGGTTVVVGAGTGTSTATSPVAKITAVTTTSLIAGEAIHVDALASTLNAGSVLTARYEWNFGDSGSNYNALVGYNAAHVYDKAGTYTVTLRVTNEGGKVSTSTLNVTVAADARPTIYVSAAGNDANDGSTTGTAVKTVARAIALLGNRSNVQLMFRRGDTFDFTTAGIFVHGNDVAIGAYGSGTANATFRYSGVPSSMYMVTLDSGVTDTTIDDITFDSVFAGTIANSTDMPSAIWVSSSNASVRGCTFLNVGMAIFCSADGSSVLAQENTAPSVTGIRTYFMFVEGHNIVALGNTVANSTREHVFRSVGGTHVLVDDNTFTNLDRSSVDALDTAKSVINIQVGSYVYIAGNTFDGDVSFGPLGTTAMLPDKTQRTSYVVYEGNHQIGHALQFRHGAEHIMVRNNILEVNGSSLITVDGYNASFSRGVADLTVANNTGINNASNGNFITTYSPVDGIKLLDNLYVAPNLFTGSYNTSPVLVYDTDLSNFTTIDGNDWGTADGSPWAEGGINWMGTANVSASYQTAAEWNALAGVGTDLFVDVTLAADYTPVGNASTVNGGTRIAGVLTDYYGDTRSATASTIGAVQA